MGQIVIIAMIDDSSSSSDEAVYSDGGNISSSVAPSRRTTPQTPRTTGPIVDDTTQTPVKKGPSIQLPTGVEPSIQPEKTPPADDTPTAKAADLETQKGQIV